mgnify:CR=1 FL=1
MIDYLELELQHRQMLDALKNQNDLQVFPGCIDILKQNAYIYKKEIEDFKTCIANQLKDRGLDEFQKETVILLNMLNPHIKELIANHKFVTNYLLRLNTMKDKNLNYYTFQRKNAKSKSILEIAERLGYKPNQANMIKCPFHEENTPSLKLYPDTNSFHCFGCNAGGDNITFVIKSKKLSYQQAIDFIVNL